MGEICLECSDPNSERPEMNERVTVHKLPFHLGILTHEDGTDTLSRNVGK
jgi:hypothetical protein